MKLGLINSVWIHAGQPTEYGLRKTKELGFDSVDICTDPLGIDVRERRLIKDECDGKVHGDLPPGQGVVDFAPYLREIKDLNIDGAISIELEYPPEPDSIVQWVEEAYRETDRRMQAAGLRD